MCRWLFWPSMLRTHVTVRTARPNSCLCRYCSRARHGMRPDIRRCDEHPSKGLNRVRGCGHKRHPHRPYVPVIAYPAQPSTQRKARPGSAVVGNGRPCVRCPAEYADAGTSSTLCDIRAAREKSNAAFAPLEETPGGVKELDAFIAYDNK